MGEDFPPPFGVHMMQGTVVSYPIPAYANVPVHEEYYQPRKYFIEDITLGQQTTVQTTEDHDFVIGLLVRLIIPSSFGTWQLNERSAYVISIPSSDEVVLDISSIGMDSFTSSTNTTLPQITPIGDVNSGQTNIGRTNNRTYIPGSFINISPQ